MAPDQLGRLRDILQAAQLIAGYVRGVTKPQFVENTEVPPVTPSNLSPPTDHE